MNTIAVRKYAMLVRVRDFGAARADLFPPGSLGARTFEEIGTVVDRLNVSVTSERAGRRAARQGVVSKAAARERLRRALEAVSRTARGVALDTPDMLGTFQMPDRPSDHELATAARQFAEDAAPLGAAFIAHGLSESFVADLRAALATFERAISGRALGQETHVGARADISAALDLAFETLQRLDAIVENRVGGDPNALAAWHLARNVGRTPAKGGAPAPAAPSQAPTAAAPSAAAPPVVATLERLVPPALPPVTPAV
jgi:hypothetical protein